MQSTASLTAKGKPKLPAKSIALPVEHGAWGFLFEPIAAGLILAPSAAAPFITLLVVGAFLTRQPLKFLLGDWLQRRSLPRTELALRFVLIFGGTAAVGLAGSLLLAPLYSLVPFALVAPLVVYLIIQDVARRSRDLMPELFAACALASTIAVLVLAAGFTFQFAVALWAIMVARLVPSVLYVRGRLRLEKGKEFSRFVPIAAHVAALAALIAFYYVGYASILTVLMAGFLAGRAGLGLSQYRQVLKAKVIGIWEVAYGTLYALSIVMGYYLAV